ncbi:MAG: DNA polymerase III subunit delta [Candidatus Omnitrophota bacterium]
MVSSNSSVFLFIGKEEYLKERALKKLKDSLFSGPSEALDYKIFYGGETGAAAIIEYAATLPFFSSKRLLVIKGFDDLPKEDRSRLIEYFKKPSRSAYFAVDSASGSILKDFPSAKGLGTVMRFDELTDEELFSWLKRRASSLGKEMHREAIEILKELKGNDLLSLDSEMEKLSLYTGRRSEITAGDVEELVGRSMASSAFEIAEAIGDSDTDRALEISYDLMNGGKKVQEIIGILAWHFKRLLKGKLLQAGGLDGSSLAYEAGVNRKNAAQFLKQVKAFDIKTIESKMGILLEADLDVKRTKFDPALILEFGIMRLCLGERR